MSALSDLNPLSVVHGLASHEDTKGKKLKMASFVIFVALCEFREVLNVIGDCADEVAFRLICLR